METLVEYAVTGSFARLTLNSPQNRNALSTTLVSQLHQGLRDAAADPAVNYGETGATIGHEMGHGFDDEGRQFDATGNLKNWWTKKDAAEFDKRTQCLVGQYGQ